MIELLNSIFKAVGIKTRVCSSCFRIHKFYKRCLRCNKHLCRECVTYDGIEEDYCPYCLFVIVTESLKEWDISPITKAILGVDTLRVGDIVKVSKPCLSNPSDSYAICFEVYNTGNKPRGWGLIFENGHYDRFYERDIKLFGVRFYRHCHPLSDYIFTNVTELEKDFRRGVFKMGFDLIQK